MKTQVDLVDNLGETIEEFVADPETTIALANPSIGERSSAPVDQLINRDIGPTFADWYGQPIPVAPTLPPEEILVFSPHALASFALGSISL